MFNPVHHHCHLFTDFYKGFICVEIRPFLIARKSDTFILWRACLLVVPAGLDPRTYSIGTLHVHFGFRKKKCWKPKKWIFNDQITKTFFNNVFNNKMHKIFIGFFIPTIYTVYCIIFHGMNNQFETLRVKNGMTTKVIKVSKNFTTVSFTTNDVMD